MDVVVSGASGFIGTALTRSLRAAGHRVVPLVRRPVRPGEDAITWDPAAGTLAAGALDGVDAVVHLAGAGVADKRWSDARKQEILQSRTSGTTTIAEAIAHATAPPKVLVSASGMDYYGDAGDRELTEDDPAGDTFLAHVCVAWEGAAKPAAAAGVRTTFLRTTMVLGPDGGALVPLLRLFKLGLGGKLGSGEQWWSWISLTDHVRAIRFLIDHEVRGPVNLAAPGPVTNAAFTRALAQAVHRPAILPVPAFAPKLILGSELAASLLFESKRVIPKALTAQGFTFDRPELDGALAAELG